MSHATMSAEVFHKFYREIQPQIREYIEGRLDRQSKIRTIRGRLQVSSKPHHLAWVRRIDQILAEDQARTIAPFNRLLENLGALLGAILTHDFQSVSLDLEDLKLLGWWQTIPQGRFRSW